MQNNLYLLCAEENLLRKIRYVITEKKTMRETHAREDERTKGRETGVREDGTECGSACSSIHRANRAHNIIRICHVSHPKTHIFMI